jgi:hypothetical protein
MLRSVGDLIFDEVLRRLRVLMSRNRLLEAESGKNSHLRRGVGSLYEVICAVKRNIW